MTSFGNVSSAGWLVTLCDPAWQVSSRSGVAGLHYPREPLYRVYFTYLLVSRGYPGNDDDNDAAAADGDVYKILSHH